MMFKKMICHSIAVGMLSLPISSIASTLTWNWSFGGTEAGTFETDGSFANAISATPGSLFLFTFDGTSFDVTASILAANVGASYFDPFPNSGFFWDGTQATQFFRNSDTGIADSIRATRTDNTAVIYSLDTSFALTDSGFSDVLIISSAALTPASSAVPVPAAVWLFTSGLLGLVGVARRKMA